MKDREGDGRMRERRKMEAGLPQVSAEMNMAGSARMEENSPDENHAQVFMGILEGKQPR